jgi:hypothetical protein
MDREVQHIIKDLKKAYGIKYYFTDSGYKEGAITPYKTLVRTAKDVISITGYKPSYKEFELDLVGAYDEFSKTTYLYCPCSRYLTKIEKGHVYYNGKCPIRITSFQSLLLNIYMRRV